MKIRYFPAIGLCIFAVLLAASCSRKGTAPEIQAAIDRSGIVAWQGAPFYVDESGAESPKVEWKASLDFGAAVKLTGEAKTRSVLVGGQALDLVAVELSSAENLPGLTTKGPISGWMQPTQFAGNGAEPAVVTAPEAAVQQSASQGGTVLARLPRLSLIAIDRKVSPPFVKVVGPDPISRNRYPAAYIEAQQVSVSRDDVRAAVLVARAQDARNPGEKQALLEDAERSFPATVFINDIHALLGDAKPAEGPSSEHLVADLAARTDDARILSAPSADAAVVATLKKDDVVHTVSRTVGASAVGGQSAHWYEVDSPAHGWVFGADLEGAD